MSDRPLAVVTGGGRGIGASISRALAGAGYDLVLAARTRSELEAVAAECGESGARALVVPTDLRVAAEVDRLVAATVERRVPDLLVNNSGISGPSGVLWNLDPA
ncbi:MAG: SDR family NAD(P)-dependent oxidoreductase, partial [Acidimicrobiia bacterium]